MLVVELFEDIKLALHVVYFDSLGTINLLPGKLDAFACYFMYISTRATPKGGTLL